MRFFGLPRWGLLLFLDSKLKRAALLAFSFPFALFLLILQYLPEIISRQGNEWEVLLVYGVQQAEGGAEKHEKNWIAQ